MLLLNTDTNLWDHLDSGAGVWSGLSDGSSGTEGPTSQFLQWGKLGDYWNQEQQASLISQQHAPHNGK